MGKRITEEQFEQTKKYITANEGIKAQVAASGVSAETIRKVKNSKDFADYQRQNKISHRKTPSNTYTAPQPKKDTRGFWARLFNI